MIPISEYLFEFLGWGVVTTYIMYTFWTVVLILVVVFTFKLLYPLTFFKYLLLQSVTFNEFWIKSFIQFMEVDFSFFKIIFDFVSTKPWPKDLSVEALRRIQRSCFKHPKVFLSEMKVTNYEKRPLKKAEGCSSWNMYIT